MNNGIVLGNEKSTGMQDVYGLNIDPASRITGDWVALRSSDRGGSLWGQIFFFFLIISGFGFESRGFFGPSLGFYP